MRLQCYILYSFILGRTHLRCDGGVVEGVVVGPAVGAGGGAPGWVRPGHVVLQHL